MFMLRDITFAVELVKKVNSLFVGYARKVRLQKVRNTKSDRLFAEASFLVFFLLAATLKSPLFCSIWPV